jgi:hypothetical protein
MVSYSDGRKQTENVLEQILEICSTSSYKERRSGTSTLELRNAYVLVGNPKGIGPLGVGGKVTLKHLDEIMLVRKGFSWLGIGFSGIRFVKAAVNIRFE